METEKIVYGPVKSRRLGQSLGINLTPSELKTCNFSCGYCRVGVPSKGNFETEDFEKYEWTPGNIKRAITTGLEDHARRETPVDYITLAGNGEPTLYPWFGEIIDHLLEERKKYLPDKPTALFTNSTTLDQRAIKESIYRLDRRFFKLDAGDERAFRRTNMPIGVDYEKIIQNLLSLTNYELSMAITNGDFPNYESFFDSRFLENLKKMQFTRLFLYDIDIPRTTSPRFNKKVSKEKLENLAEFFSEQLDKNIGEDIVILWEPTLRNANIPLYPLQLN
tara:strand:- start:752 stop:1585 length:834 start_codon:yes stop_codon:yes gene_type:complete